MGVSGHPFADTVVQNKRLPAGNVVSYDKIKDFEKSRGELWSEISKPCGK